MSLSWLAFWGPRPYTMTATGALTVYNAGCAWLLRTTDGDTDAAAYARIALAVVFMAASFGVGNTGKATDPRDISWEATYINGPVAGVGMCTISLLIPIFVIVVLVVTPYLTMTYFTNGPTLY